MQQGGGYCHLEWVEDISLRLHEHDGAFLAGSEQIAVDLGYNPRAVAESGLLPGLYLGEACRGLDGDELAPLAVEFLEMQPAVSSEFGRYGQCTYRMVAPETVLGNHVNVLIHAAVLVKVENVTGTSCFLD